jgi:hypothetical protein
MSNGYEVAYEAIANMINACTSFQIADSALTQYFTNLLALNNYYWFAPVTGVITQVLDAIEKNEDVSKNQALLTGYSTIESTDASGIEGQQSAFETSAQQDATNQSAIVALSNSLAAVLSTLASLTAKTLG